MKAMKAPLQNKTARCMYRQWDYNYSAFGTALKLARHLKHLTQREVSQYCRCARSTVWRMENGASCNPQTMVKACELLDVDLMLYNEEPGTEEQRKRQEL